VNERNFCERCGKRLGGKGHIHTCTPPAAPVGLGAKWIAAHGFDKHGVAKWIESETGELAPQPVPVKTYHDGKPWPVAPVPDGPYSAPIKELWPVAPKPWVGLTYQERKDIINNSMTPACVVIATEAKLREKNGGAV
jgi:hypothetical protein